MSFCIWRWLMLLYSGKHLIMLRCYAVIFKILYRWFSVILTSIIPDKTEDEKKKNECARIRTLSSVNHSHYHIVSHYV